MISARTYRPFALLAALLLPLIAAAAPPPGGEYAVRVQSVTLPNQDAAEVYAPALPRALYHRFTDAFAMIAFLQGAKVDKAQYSRFARLLAAQGYVVVIPNHTRTVTVGTYSDTGLYTAVNVVTAVLEQLTAADTDPASPLFRIVDTGRMAVVGHSFGGTVGIYALSRDGAAQTCEPMTCEGPYTRPAALKAGVFYGTSLIAPYNGVLTDRDTTGTAVALIEGTLDGVVAPAKADRTLPTLELPHALISVAGANHYGICNVTSPPGAGTDPSAQTLDQPAGIEEIARWTGLWLRAHL